MSYEVKDSFKFYIFSNWSTRRFVFPFLISRRVLYLSLPWRTFSWWRMSFLVTFVSSLFSDSSWLSNYWNIRKVISFNSRMNLRMKLTLSCCWRLSCLETAVSRCSSGLGKSCAPSEARSTKENISLRIPTRTGDKTTYPYQHRWTFHWKWFLPHPSQSRSLEYTD